MKQLNASSYMYKSTLLFLAFLFATYTSSAQYLYPEKFKGCVLGFGLDLGDPKAKMPENFTKVLISNINKDGLSKIVGSIEVQILIDTLGRPCLLSANNTTNIKSKTLNLQTAINNTPNWEPAVYYGKKTDVCVMLLVQFKNETLTVTRIKFNTATIRNK